VALTYYITDRRQLSFPAASGPPESVQTDLLRKKIRAAFQAGVDYVQVREKDLEARPLAALVEELAGMPEKRGARLLANERADVALASEANGVHLPSDSLPAAAVRNWAGKDWTVGVSCHCAQDVEDAAAAGADYVLCGPVFETPSKPGAKPLGMAALAAICRRFAIPVFALGGVDLSNARACVEAGAKGIAGIRLYQNAPDLSEICRHLRAL